jgi:hypothetical protein
VLAPRPVALGPKLAKAAGLLAVLLAVVLGGPLVDGALLSEAGPPLPVTPDVRLAPLPGWRLAVAQDGQRPALLTRGSGSLAVLSSAGGADPAALVGAYLRERLAPAGADLLVADAEPVLAAGVVAERVAYRGQFDAGDRHGALAGEVTALVSPAGTSVVFDAWAMADTYPYERQDAAAMIARAQVR